MMCVAVPGKVITSEEGQALVDVNGVSRRVSCVGLPDVRPGDFVLVSLGMAVERISEGEARALQSLWADVAAAQDRLMRREAGNG